MTVQYLDIPLDQLHDSPTQPRLAYPEAYLQQLAADIKSHGRNLSPLLVRPIVPPLFAAVGDEALSRDATAGYEIVFGHCRRRALELAGLTHARCEVRSMTDIEVQLAQISENLARQDVHPFEEAQAYAALIEKHADTADDIALRTGKSRSYVYGRLKLLQACPEVRKACVAGEIGAEVALLIARLRSDKLQSKALHRISAKAWDLKDGGQRSYRNIRDLLNEEFTLDIKSAPFPIDADNLAGAGPCPTCPKRSANAPEFQDVAEGVKPNVCTDPECFAAKKAAHFKNQANDLRRKGREVIDGNRARALVGADGKVKGGYLPLASVKDELKRANAATKAGKAIAAPAIVVIQDPRTGKTHEAVKEADLVAAGLREAPVSVAGKKPIAGPEETPEQMRQRHAEARAAAVAKTEQNKRLLTAVRDAARQQDRSEFDLRLIVRGLIERDEEFSDGGLNIVCELRGVTGNELRNQVDLLPAAELALLMLDIVLATDCDGGYWSSEGDAAPLHLAAKHYGVELPEGSLPLPPAARAGNGTAEADADDAHSGQDHDAATTHPAGSAVESSSSTPAHAGEGVPA